ncbi:MAG: hypothetical protein AB9907_09170 [Flexilinea sp.]
MMIWNYVIGGGIIIIVGLVILRIIIKRQKGGNGCAEFHSIYGIPDSEIPAACTSCPAKMLCKKNPGIPYRKRPENYKTEPSDTPRK